MIDKLPEGREAELIALHLGQRYSAAEADKLRQLGYVMVEHQAISEPDPRYLVAGWAPIES